MKRSGPELKVPKGVSDLYYDLHDRRLLPLIALILVAIAAVPVLLGDDAEEAAPPPASGVAKGTGVEASASSLAVVEATPGLRDYRKRLDGRKPSDPFAQQYREPAGSTGGGGGGGDAGGGGTGGPAAGGGTTGAAGETGVESPGAGTPGGSAGGDGSGRGSPPSGEGEVKLFKFVGDVQISRTEASADGKTKMGDAKTRHGVEALTPLPGPKAPVVTFLGPNLETERAIFTISKDVTAIEGRKVCLAGVDRCELLEVELGSPLVLEYGANRVRYKLKVIKFDVVPAEKGEAAASVQRFTK